MAHSSIYELAAILENTHETNKKSSHDNIRRIREKK